ncbi:MAG: DUF2867 domain-containing protein [Actinomycetota bacterium]
MRVANEVHHRRTWVIDEIAHDFDLLDVWAIPVRGTKSELLALVERIAAFDPTASGPSVTRALFRVREVLGRVFRWDDPDKERPIPGCAETSLAARVPRALAETAGDLSVGAAIRRAGAKPLFATDDECAIEIVNDTVHGVLHFGLVEAGDGRSQPHMAIYVKPHGLLGRLYVKAIAPFRHLIVYPALMRRIERMVPSVSYRA